MNSNWWLSLTLGLIALNATQAAPPNVVYILADDLGYGDLGCYGGTQLKTPHIDQLARDGKRFTQHYAGSTVCAPSRCVLLTGKHTGHCSVRGNSPGLLAADEPSLGRVLQAAGYRTGCFGKWGVGNPPPLDDPARHGFAEFYGYVSMWHAHNCYPEFVIHNGQRVPLANEVDAEWKASDGRGIATKRLEFVPDLAIEESLKFMEANKSQPFFVLLSINLPHANNEADVSLRPERGLEAPNIDAFAARDWPAPERGFAAVMQRLDDYVGRVTQRLDELGLSENTVVMFSSDNGPHSEGGHTATFFDSNGPLRGEKRDLYEGGIRVPMIVRWPEHVAAGSETNHISGFQDVLPTLCELAATESPPTLDGLSFAPTLLGEHQRQAQHEYLYWEFSELGGRRALRRGDWKLVQLDVCAEQPGEFELYNLAKDVAEEQNLAAEAPELVAELVAVLEAVHTPNAAYPLLRSEGARPMPIVK